ncbi:ATP dependent DNA helicase [Gigaspora margarita]|uniref:ATP dependent DNA helicase n=1 Tax=Gigaspora margarita TaxID=4874 RepID=A0A8H3X2D5_GIGMA|nr:ATP dependent DNA helicase [Gigaspora margarita]
MSFYTKCIYAASSKAYNPEVSTLIDEELAYMYTKGLICHLQENHNKEFENLDLSLPFSNLISTNENQCMWLLEFFKKITKLKENQSLTTIHTSYNKAFNCL